MTQIKVLNLFLDSPIALVGYIHCQTYQASLVRSGVLFYRFREISLIDQDPLVIPCNSFISKSLPILPLLNGVIRAALPSFMLFVIHKCIR